MKIILTESQIKWISKYRIDELKYSDHNIIRGVDRLGG